MDKLFHPIHYNVCNYLSMLGLKLNHVSKRGHRFVFDVCRYSFAVVTYVKCGHDSKDLTCPFGEIRNELCVVIDERNFSDHHPKIILLPVELQPTITLCLCSIADACSPKRRLIDMNLQS